MNMNSYLPKFPGRALSLVLGMALPMAAIADSKLNELKKRKVDLDKLAAECAEKTDPSSCLNKYEKVKAKYKADLEKYKAELAKDQSRPATSSDMKSSIESREESIKGFVEYVNSCTEKTDRCASALFQVANLTYQNEEDAFLVKQKAYEKEFERWEDRDRKGAEPLPPRRDHARSMGYFERFLKDYPSHKDAAPALIRAAYISDISGNETRAYEYLNLMVTRFPDHPLSIQAHLRLGEHWLLKRKYAKAIEHYEHVPLNYPGPEAGLALYHRAEAYYNMADFEAAAKWYYEYVKLSDAGKLRGDLREEAMAFMAASWADLDDGFAVAERFLRSKGNPKWENDVYYEIGVKNKGHDRLEESLKAFKFLLEKDPTYPRAPVADLNIVEILVILKKAEEAQAARIELVERYHSGSNWYRRNSGDTKAMEEAQKAIKMAMYSIPVYYHQVGDKENDPDMLRKAEQGYKDYLSRYSGEESWDNYLVHQNLAVLYGKMKQQKMSAQEWKWCATVNTSKLGKIPADKKNLIQTADAGFNAVIAMDEARKDALAGKYNNDTTAAYRGTETSEYFQYLDWYMGTFGNAPAAADLAYNGAFVHYEAKQYAKAIEKLSSLIEKFPNHKNTNLIRRALASSLLESGRFEEAEQQLTLLKNKVCPQDKDCADVKKALASAQFKQAEAKAKNGDYEGAGRKYEQLAREFRDVDIAEKALFEAGVAYDSAGKTDEGVRILLRIHKEYPKSELRVKSILKAASIYMARKKYNDAGETFLLIQRNFPEDSMGILSIAWAADAFEKVPNLKKAAQTYEYSYRAYPKHEKTPGYLYNAGQTYEQAKEFPDAIQVYNLLGDKYPKSQYAVEALFSVPLLLEKKGDYAKAAAAYEQFAKEYANERNKSIRAHLGAGKNYESLGKEKQALDHFEACLKIQEKYGEKEMIPPAIAAEAGYRAGEVYYKRIQKISLDGSKATNQRRIEQMQRDLVPSIQNFAKAVQMAEEEWTLRATMRMGDLFATIARISDNERVAGLGRDDRINAQIESKAAVPGYLEKACELYRKNLDIAMNQGISSPWVDSSGYRLLEAYHFKGQAMEELSALFLQAPLPPNAGEEEKEQLKAASDETKANAVATYKEALNVAQAYYLDIEPRSRILARLRGLEPEAQELALQVGQKPQVASGSEGGSVASSDPKFDANMRRIQKVFENKALSDEQKIELLTQMEAEARREITELRSEMATVGAGEELP